MKIKSPPQVLDTTGHTSRDIVKHIQAVTDDVRQILSGGLSFKDNQLPFQIVQKTVSNNIPVQLSISKPYTVSGAYPIQTGTSTVLTFKSSISNGILSVTLTMDISPAQISFLVVGTS